MMKNKIKIAPSILAADFANLGKAVSDITAAGADWIHVDVMDGNFVPNISIGSEMVAALRSRSDCVFDVHLMVDRPERHIEAFASAGADILTCHPEAGLHIHRTLQAVRDLGCKAGLVLNPGTPANTIEPLLDLVDLVLVMSVNPGFGGQVFLKSQLKKLRQIRKMIDESGLPILLEIDGGINAKTAKEAISAGADILVAGTAIFRGDDDLATNIAALRGERAGA